MGTAGTVTAPGYTESLAAFTGIATDPDIVVQALNADNDVIAEVSI